MAYSVNSTPLDGVTATTTSQAVSLKDAKRVTFEFIRADHSSGSSKFEVFGSVDGSNYDIPVMMVKNVANTNSQTLLRAVSTTLSSNTQAMWFLDDFIGLDSIKIKVTETTDGTHTARLFVQY